VPAFKLLKEASEAAVQSSHEKDLWVSRFIDSPETRQEPGKAISHALEATCSSS
jgi:hypothetical protein